MEHVAVRPRPHVPGSHPVALRPRDAQQVSVRVEATDTLSATGLRLVLESHAGLVRTRPGARPDVLVFSTPHVNAAAVAQLRALQPSGVAVVLLTAGVEEAALLTLIEHGVVAIVDSKSADGAELAAAVSAAAHQHSVMPRDLLGTLIGLVRRMQRETLGPLGVNSAGLTEREVEVLRLLADGAETAEIARKLTYSESTIKHVLHSLTTRYKLRNRVQAVAFALRAGVL
ncbi:LuxR C-terminal-related transcriptional regulator [Amycolatopsis sp. NPDC005232]|uniref:helix-turn-helix transcriptional regulator n=1 Tax=Amycolatopsis sp. NPDC005232 TaxID=3157027 RepID=UPI0033BCDDD3